VAHPRLSRDTRDGLCPRHRAVRGGQGGGDVSEGSVWGVCGAAHEQNRVGLIWSNAKGSGGSLGGRRN
jgi:hypothetical protein